MAIKKIKAEQTNKVQQNSKAKLPDLSISISSTIGIQTKRVTIHEKKL